MRVYVAGRVHDLKLVRRVQEMVVAEGHEISFDWTPMVERWGGRPATTPPEVRQNAAIRDREGVLTAHLLIAIGHATLTGTLWECGMAAAIDIPIWLVEWERCERRSIFEDLPEVEYMDLYQVRDSLRLFNHTQAIDERTYKGKIEG